MIQNQDDTISNSSSTLMYDDESIRMGNQDIQSIMYTDPSLPSLNSQSSYRPVCESSNSNSTRQNCKCCRCKKKMEEQRLFNLSRTTKGISEQLFMSKPKQRREQHRDQSALTEQPHVNSHSTLNSFNNLETSTRSNNHPQEQKKLQIWEEMAYQLEQKQLKSRNQESSNERDHIVNKEDSALAQNPIASSNSSRRSSTSKTALQGRKGSFQKALKDGRPSIQSVIDGGVTSTRSDSEVVFFMSTREEDRHPSDRGSNPLSEKTSSEEGPSSCSSANLFPMKQQTPPEFRNQIQKVNEFSLEDQRQFNQNMMQQQPWNMANPEREEINSFQEIDEVVDSNSKLGGTLTTVTEEMEGQNSAIVKSSELLETPKRLANCLASLNRTRANDQSYELDQARSPLMNYPTSRQQETTPQNFKTLENEVQIMSQGSNPLNESTPTEPTPQIVTQPNISDFNQDDNQPSPRASIMNLLNSNDNPIQQMNTIRDLRQDQHLMDDEDDDDLNNRCLLNSQETLLTHKANPYQNGHEKGVEDLIQSQDTAPMVYEEFYDDHDSQFDNSGLAPITEAASEEEDRCTTVNKNHRHLLNSNILLSTHSKDMSIDLKTIEKSQRSNAMYTQRNRSNQMSLSKRERRNQSYSESDQKDRMAEDRLVSSQVTSSVRLAGVQPHSSRVSEERKTQKKEYKFIVNENDLHGKRLDFENSFVHTSTEELKQSQQSINPQPQTQVEFAKTLPQEDKEKVVPQVEENEQLKTQEQLPKLNNTSMILNRAITPLGNIDPNQVHDTNVKPSDNVSTNEELYKTIDMKCKPSQRRELGIPEIFTPTQEENDRYNADGERQYERQARQVQDENRPPLSPLDSNKLLFQTYRSDGGPEIQAKTTRNERISRNNLTQQYNSQKASTKPLNMTTVHRTPISKHHTTSKSPVSKSPQEIREAKIIKTIIENDQSDWSKGRPLSYRSNSRQNHNTSIKQYGSPKLVSNTGSIVSPSIKDQSQVLLFTQQIDTSDKKFLNESSYLGNQKPTRPPRKHVYQQNSMEKKLDVRSDKKQKYITKRKDLNSAMGQTNPNMQSPLLSKQGSFDRQNQSMYGSVQRRQPEVPKTLSQQAKDHANQRCMSIESTSRGGTESKVHFTEQPKPVVTYESKEIQTSTSQLPPYEPTQPQQFVQQPPTQHHHQVFNQHKPPLQTPTAKDTHLLMNTTHQSYVTNQTSAERHLSNTIMTSGSQSRQSEPVNIITNQHSFSLERPQQHSRLLISKERAPNHKPKRVKKISKQKFLSQGRRQGSKQSRKAPAPSYSKIHSNKRSPAQTIPREPSPIYVNDNNVDGVSRQLDMTVQAEDQQILQVNNYTMFHPQQLPERHQQPMHLVGRKFPKGRKGRARTKSIERDHKQVELKSFVDQAKKLRKKKRFIKKGGKKGKVKKTARPVMQDGNEIFHASDIVVNPQQMIKGRQSGSRHRQQNSISNEHIPNGYQIAPQQSRTQRVQQVRKQHLGKKKGKRPRYIKKKLALAPKFSNVPLKPDVRQTDLNNDLSVVQHKQPEFTHPQVHPHTSLPLQPAPLPQHLKPPENHSLLNSNTSSICNLQQHDALKAIKTPMNQTPSKRHSQGSAIIHTDKRQETPEFNIINIRTFGGQNSQKLEPPSTSIKSRQLSSQMNTPLNIPFTYNEDRMTLGVGIHVEEGKKKKRESSVERLRHHFDQFVNCQSEEDEAQKDDVDLQTYLQETAFNSQLQSKRTSFESDQENRTRNKQKLFTFKQSTNEVVKPDMKQEIEIQDENRENSQSNLSKLSSTTSLQSKHQYQDTFGMIPLTQNQLNTQTFIVKNEDKTPIQDINRSYHDIPSARVTPIQETSSHKLASEKSINLSTNIIKNEITKMNGQSNVSKGSDQVIPISSFNDSEDRQESIAGQLGQDQKRLEMSKRLAQFYSLKTQSDRQSNGSVNRERRDTNKFSNFSIPVPLDPKYLGSDINSEELYYGSKKDASEMNTSRSIEGQIKHIRSDDGSVTLLKAQEPCRMSGTTLKQIDHTQDMKPPRQRKASDYNKGRARYSIEQSIPLNTLRSNTSNISFEHINQSGSNSSRVQVEKIDTDLPKVQYVQKLNNNFDHFDKPVEKKHKVSLVSNKIMSHMCSPSSMIKKNHSQMYSSINSIHSNNSVVSKMTTIEDMKYCLEDSPKVVNRSILNLKSGPTSQKKPSGLSSMHASNDMINLNISNQSFNLPESRPFVDSKQIQDSRPIAQQSPNY